MNFREIFDQLPPGSRSQTNARRVLKAVDDARRLKEQARYVLTIDKHGNPVSFIHNHTNFPNLIAVLGPAEVFGIKLEEAVVLEIGISRARPYKATERVTYRGKKKLSKKRFGLRERVRAVRSYELVKFWPALEKVFSSATYQTRLKWKTKEGWWTTIRRGAGKMVYEFERGVHFSVNHRDRAVKLFVLREEQRRRHEFLRGYAKAISAWLHRYVKKSYTEKRLKKLQGVIRAIESWKHVALPPDEQGVVVSAMSRSTQVFFTRALSAHGVQSLMKTRPVLKSATRRNHPMLKNGVIQLVYENGSVHGRDCLLFEFTFRRSFREEFDL